MLDEQTVAFPNYDGNGMYLSMGNVLENPHVGMLFIDFVAARPSRLRLNGIASIDAHDELIRAYPGAQFVVRVQRDAGVPELPSLHPPNGARRALAVRAARRRRNADPGLEAVRLGVRRAAQRRPGGHTQLIPHDLDRLDPLLRRQLEAEHL